MDGFRFDLASALCRDPLGNPLAVPPLIEQCAKDPVLSKARCILPRGTFACCCHTSMGGFAPVSHACSPGQPARTAFPMHQVCVAAQVKLIAEPWDCGGLYQVRPMSVVLCTQLLPKAVSAMH